MKYIYFLFILRKKILIKNINNTNKILFYYIKGGNIGSKKTKKTYLMWFPFLNIQ